MLRLLLVMLIVSASPMIWAAEFVVPPLTGPVVDQAGMLSPRTEQQMDRFIRGLRDAGGTQLQILIVPELAGFPIEEASIQVVDQWKLGTAKEDNGVLLMVAAKERRIRIEVGQGREGVLPDVRASRIIREVMVPRFREGNADAAITAGVFAILHYTDPEFLEQSGHTPPRSSSVGREVEIPTWLMIPFMIFAFVIMSLRSRFQRRGLWGGRHVDYWGSGGGFGGGGFGGGGGGWGGGGGGFSGGGASGGW